MLVWLATAPAAGAKPLVVPQWQTPVEIPAPANEQPADSNTGMSSVTCPRAGDCTAVGSYSTDDLDAPMVAEEVNGAWQGAMELPDPEAALSPSGFESAFGVSCVQPGLCVAVGQAVATDAQNGGGDYNAIIWTENGAAWSEPTQIGPPSNAATPDPDAEFDAVSCVSGGCTAVGNYDVYPAGESYPNGYAMAASETDGTWTGTQALAPLPGDQNEYVYAVSCVSPGNCTAVGDNGEQPLVWTQSAGIWSAAQLLSAPAGAVQATLAGVSCPALGDCSAVGSYSNSGSYGLPLVADETNGNWSAPLLGPRPAGFPPVGKGQQSGLTSVSCTSPGNCTAGGIAEVDAGNVEPMDAIELDGAWNGATVLGEPPNAPPGPNSQRAHTTSISCPQAGACAMLGNYDATNAELYFGITSTPADIAPLTVSTGGLPHAHESAVYHATLSAAGGTGKHSWSISSGSLPAGLSLNTSTGAIRGVPKHPGKAHFTVVASDPGLPIQQATMNESIVVGGLRMLHATFADQRISIGLPDGCAQVNAPFPVTINSTKIKRRGAATVTFRRALLTFAVGPHPFSYAAKHVPAKLDRVLFVAISGTHTVKITLTYQDAHRPLTTTLRQRFSLCSVARRQSHSFRDLAVYPSSHRQQQTRFLPPTTSTSIVRPSASLPLPHARSGRR